MYTVIGASGFIGGNLTSYLRSLGHQVNTPPRGDVHHNEHLGRVVYCAGVTADFRTRPFDTVEAHVSLLARYLEHGNFDSFLYLSSSRIYMKSPGGEEKQDIIVNPNDPSDLYNISKAMGEALLLSSGPGNVKVARISNVLGPDASSSNFVMDLCRQSLTGHIALQTALSSSKDYIHVDDLVRYLHLLSSESARSLYNVASGTNITHRAIVEKIVEFTGCGFSVESSAPEIDQPRIDASALHAEFGLPQRDPLDGVSEIISELKERN